MPSEHVLFGTPVFRPIHPEGPGRRSAASYERELAEHRATESRLREAAARDAALLREKEKLIDRQELLSQECHHRLLNNLQMIAGLLSLQGQMEANSAAASRLAMAASRVQTIAHLHHHLHSIDATQTVEFRPYVEELCRDHSAMSMSEESPDRLIAVEAIELSLPTTTGVSLGLIVNELLTNALKHGEGPITVRLASRPSGGYALSVSNKGPGLPEGCEPRASKGLGMFLISALARQIGGNLRIDRGDDNESTRFTVVFT